MISSIHEAEYRCCCLLKSVLSALKPLSLFRDAVSHAVTVSFSMLVNMAMGKRRPGFGKSFEMGCKAALKGTAWVMVGLKDLVGLLHP